MEGCSPKYFFQSCCCKQESLFQFNICYGLATYFLSQGLASLAFARLNHVAPWAACQNTRLAYCVCRAAAYSQVRPCRVVEHISDTYQRLIP